MDLDLIDLDDSVNLDVDISPSKASKNDGEEEYLAEFEDQDTEENEN